MCVFTSRRVERGETAPDWLLFADVGIEKPETYEYLPIFNAWLRDQGWPEVTVVSRYGATGLYGSR